jgi:hypothetical protein
LPKQSLKFVIARRPPYPRADSRGSPEHRLLACAPSGFATRCFPKRSRQNVRWPHRLKAYVPTKKTPDGFWPSGILICRSAAKTELCVTVSEFFKPRFLSIPRA